MGFKDNAAEGAPDAPAPSTTAALGGYAEGETYVPAGAVKKGLPLPAVLHPDFRLMYHPLRWQFFQSAAGTKGEWLPVLHAMQLSPGTDNVDKDGDPSLAIGIRSQGGWQIIEPTAQDPYIVQHAARGGIAYLTRWQRVKVLGNTAFVSSDEDGYRTWLRSLCARRGWKPDDDIVAMKRAEVAQELATDGGDVTNPKATARAKATQKMLDAIDGKAPARGKASPKVEGE